MSHYQSFPGARGVMGAGAIISVFMLSLIQDGTRFMHQITGYPPLINPGRHAIVT